MRKLLDWLMALKREGYETITIDDVIARIRELRLSRGGEKGKD